MSKYSPTVTTSPDGTYLVTNPACNNIHQKHATNLQTADKLALAGHTHKAQEITSCNTTMDLYYCEHCTDAHYRTHQCKQPYCAICAPKRATEQAAKTKAIVDKMSNPVYITLTTPTHRYLQSGIEHVLHSFDRWRRQSYIAKRLKGGLRKLEVVPKHNGWHIHLHIIADCTWISQNKLCKSWAQAAKLSMAVCHIRQITDLKSIRDHAKYNCKPQDIAQMSPETLKTYVDVMTNRRTVQPFGNAYDLQEDINLDQDEPPQIVCPHCGSVGTCVPASAAYAKMGGDLAEEILHMHSDLPAIKTAPGFEYTDQPSENAPELDPAL